LRLLETVVLTAAVKPIVEMGVKVVRMRITAAGRRALSKLRWP
jgi:hypothetical protein